MQNGLLKIQRYAHLVTKQLRGLKAVILWPVLAGRISAICAVSHGSQTTRTISNAIYSKKKMKTKQIERRQF